MWALPKDAKCYLVGGRWLCNDIAVLVCVMDYGLSSCAEMRENFYGCKYWLKCLKCTSRLTPHKQPTSHLTHGWRGTEQRAPPSPYTTAPMIIKALECV